MGRCKELKKLIFNKKILITPGVYDGISAKVVKQMGFHVGATTGAGLSESIIGRPDVGLMSFCQNLTAVRNITNSSGLMIISDIDTGYGNAVNAYFTVKAFEQAGVAGVQMEDQIWPKRCGHMSGKETISIEEMVGKIRAAVDAKTDPDFVVMARTDAAGTEGLEEAIKRANLYAEAGADVVFADALLSKEDIREFVRNVNVPVKINMGFGIRERATTPLCSPLELEKMGVAIVSYPRMLTASAMKGMMTTLKVISEMTETGGVIERPDLLVSFEELNEIMGLASIKRLEEKYLPKQQLLRKYGR